MIPRSGCPRKTWGRFPRVSGDDPYMEELGIHAYEFSLREWG